MKAGREDLHHLALASSSSSSAPPLPPPLTRLAAAAALGQQVGAARPGHAPLLPFFPLQAFLPLHVLGQGVVLKLPQVSPGRRVGRASGGELKHPAPVGHAGFCRDEEETEPTG